MLKDSRGILLLEFFLYIFAEIVYIMRIDDFDNETLNIGFVMPKFTDCTKVIWYCDVETFYCFILLIFYLLGCFQARFYQYKALPYVWCKTIRCVSFHPIVYGIQSQ